MSSEKSLTPQIRFKGFTEAWEQRKLSQIVSINGGKDYKYLEAGPIPVYGTGGYMTSVSQALSYNQDAIGIGRKGTIDCPYILKSPFWTIDTLFYSIPINNADLQFTLCLFLNVNWKSKDESTGLPSLSKQTIEKTLVKTPNALEQQKIGLIFSRLNSLITLHQRKLDALKKIKSALLEKMFPKNGSNVPEIRFTGFTEAWEQRKLSDVAEIIGGGTPDTNNPSYWDGDIDWYSPAELGEQIYTIGSRRRITKEGYKNSSAKLLPANKTILFTSRAGIGTTAILCRSACTNQGFQSLVISDNTDLYFIYSMSSRIKDFAISKASGSTFLEISGKQLATMSLFLPQLNEQRKIGQYFKSLDNLITLHQRKLDALKKIKSALLEKMFV